jgi:hypothetical protein
MRVEDVQASSDIAASLSSPVLPLIQNFLKHARRYDKILMTPNRNVKARIRIGKSPTETGPLSKAFFFLSVGGEKIGRARAAISAPY